MYVTYAGCPAWLGGGERVLLARKNEWRRGSAGEARVSSEMRDCQRLAARCGGPIAAKASERASAQRRERRRAARARALGQAQATVRRPRQQRERAQQGRRWQAGGRRRRRPGAMAEARRQVLRWWSGGWSDGGGLLLWAGARARLLALAPRKAYLDASAN